MRTYLGFPRGARRPSPRILFQASDDPSQARLVLALAASLAQEFPGGSVVIATGNEGVAEAQLPQRVEVVRVPTLARRPSPRPLAAERTRRLRAKLLATLFDVFQPDLLVLDVAETDPRDEAHALLARAEAFGAAALTRTGHDPAGTACGAVAPGEGACEACRDRIRGQARAALGRRAPPG